MKIALFVVLAIAATALAQNRLLLSDRARDSMWTLLDSGGTWQIPDPAGVSPYFTIANAQGTQRVDNINAFAVRASDRFVVGGDQVTGFIYAWQDNNGDGDAEDPCESRIYATLPTRSFAFPTGVAFDSQGRLYVCNAGNGFGDDIINRLTDLNNDGDCDDAGEVVPYVADGFFGPGNGPYSPQEICFLPGGPGGRDMLFLRNSSSTLHGVYRFIDLNDNERADDAGEFNTFFSAANASGLTLSAGFTIEPDLARPGSLYFLQIASGGIDQLFRLTDLNADGDAEDPGEALLVFATSESGFTGVDAVSVPDGSVLLTDNSGKRIIRLVDADNDGTFMSPGDVRTDVLVAASLVGDVRQLALMPEPACVGDYNRSGGTPDDADVAAFFDDWNNAACRADVNGSGGTPDDADVTEFFARWNAGC